MSSGGYLLEAVARRYSTKKCCRLTAFSFTEKDSPTQLFYMNFAKFFKKKFFKIPLGDWF